MCDFPLSNKLILKDEIGGRFPEKLQRCNRVEKPEKYQGFNRIRTRDFCDTGAMLDQLSCKFHLYFTALCVHRICI